MAQLRLQAGPMVGRGRVAEGAADAGEPAPPRHTVRRAAWDTRLGRTDAPHQRVTPCRSAPSAQPRSPAVTVPPACRAPAALLQKRRAEGVGPRGPTPSSATISA